MESQLLSFSTTVKQFLKQCFRWSQSALAGGVVTDGANKEKGQGRSPSLRGVNLICL